LIYGGKKEKAQKAGKIKKLTSLGVIKHDSKLETKE
jgi:hypothetical protein